MATVVLVSFIAIVCTIGINHMAAVSNYRSGCTETTPQAETRYFLGQILKLSIALSVIVVLLKAIS